MMFTKIMGIYECSLSWCLFLSSVRDLLIWKMCSFIKLFKNILKWLFYIPLWSAKICKSCGEKKNFGEIAKWWCHHYYIGTVNLVWEWLSRWNSYPKSHKKRQFLDGCVVNLYTLGVVICDIVYCDLWPYADYTIVTT